MSPAATFVKKWREQDMASKSYVDQHAMLRRSLLDEARFSLPDSQKAELLGVIAATALDSMRAVMGTLRTVKDQQATISEQIAELRHEVYNRSGRSSIVE